MNRRADKKLARVLTQMREKGLCLIRQPDGSYAARHLGRICARLSADEAKTACADGILIAHADQQLQCSEQVDLWLKRRAIGDPQSAYGAQHRDMHRVHLIDSEGRLFTAHKNATESPLAWLRRHGGKDKAPFLTAPEFAPPSNCVRTIIVLPWHKNFVAIGKPRPEALRPKAPVMPFWMPPITRWPPKNALWRPLMRWAPAWMILFFACAYAKSVWAP